MGTIQLKRIFDSPEFDVMPREERDALLLERYLAQLEHMRANVPFFARKYSKVDPGRITSMRDIPRLVPPLFKEEIRALASPYQLLDNEVQEDLGRLFFHRGTGGTTGEPTSMLFTKGDWDAMLGAMTRPLTALKEIGETIIALNGYNQGHISGPIFDDTIRMIGGLPIVRHFMSDDERAISAMQKHRCNVIIAPARSTHKGGSVEDLLEADARLGTNYITGENIKAIICSSTNLTQETYDELRDLGIELVYNYYGSTDVLPTAVSCQENPLDLHLVEGHIALHIVDENLRPVANGERGLVLASRIGGYENGMVGLQRGTQLLNFVTGDEVTYITEPCPCGRTTPRIRDIERVAYRKEKLEGGCEVW